MALWRREADFEGKKERRMWSAKDCDMLGIHASVSAEKLLLGDVSSARGRQEAVRKELSDIRSPSVCTVQQHACCPEGEEEKLPGVLRLIDESHPPSLPSLADDPQEER